MEPPSIKGCCACGYQRAQVTLYHWYLIRANGSYDCSRVSLGGVSGTAGMERFETAAIVQRLEKCRLLAQDGVEVRLAGLINGSSTVSNGFSVELVQAFLSGFPYTWNHLLDKEFRCPKTSCEDHQCQRSSGLGLIGELSQLKFDHCHPVQGKNAPLSIQSETSCRRHGELLSVKESISEQHMAGKTQTGKEGQSLWSLTASKDNENLVHDIVPDAQVSNPNHRDDLDQGLHHSSSTIMEEVRANAIIDQSEYPVQRMQNVQGGDCQGLGDDVLDSSAVFSQSSFEDPSSDQDKKARFSTQNDVSDGHLETKKESELGANQGMNKKLEEEKERQCLLAQALSKDDEHEPLIVEDVQINKSTLTNNLEQDTLDASVENCHVKKIGNPKESQLGQGKHVRQALSCGSSKQEGPASTPAEAGKTVSDQLNQSLHNTRSRHKSNRRSASTEDIGSHSTDGLNTEPHFLAINKDFVQTLEKVSVPCGDSKPYSVSSPQHQELVGERRQSARLMSKKSNIDNVGGATAQTRNPYPDSEGIEAPVDDKAQRPESLANAAASRSSINDHMIIQEKTIVTKAVSNSICAAEAKKKELPILETESEELASSCPKRSSKNWKSFKGPDGDKATLSSSCLGKYSKRPSILPPLPCPRVQIPKEVVSTAFGLKLSRSGRLLVPPLAHWCGQSLLRDKDGRIIAISDGSKDVSNDSTGSSKFKRPAEQHLQRLQKRLYQAATDHSKKKTH